MIPKHLPRVLAKLLLLSESGYFVAIGMVGMAQKAHTIFLRGSN
jgi:hypothetical protein